MVSVEPPWNILTCASQNMDEEMPKLVANIYRANDEAVLKSILHVSLDNSSTLLFILDNSVSCICSSVKNFNGQEAVKLLSSQLRF